MVYSVHVSPVNNIKSVTLPSPPPYLISPNSIETHFPPIDLALKDPNGLLAVGANLHVETLLSAYRQGIFPWYSQGEPILWWSPSPRAVLRPEEVHIGRSLNKVLRKGLFSVTFDHAFAEVIEKCSHPRLLTSAKDDGTWITNEMKQAYIRLHRAGYAHSVECWSRDKLVGGLYGVAIGKIFFGESMFTLQSDASKVALVTLCQYLQQRNFPIIDCQVGSEHLFTMGAEEISRQKFKTILKESCPASDIQPGQWDLNEPN